MPIRNGEVFYDPEIAAVLLILKHLTDQVLPDSQERKQLSKTLDELVAEKLLTANGEYLPIRGTTEFSQLVTAYVRTFQGFISSDIETPPPFGF